MNTKRLSFFFVTAIMITSCSRIEDSTIQSDVPVALTYSTVDAIETKAAQDLNQVTFDSGESITVRISNTGENSWTDYTFTTADAGTMTAPNPGPYYPAGLQNIDIAAYYPATAGTLFTVAADQTADADYKASDLMFALVSNQSKQAEAVNLAFTHKMAKLCVNITAGAGVGSINSVTILNVKPTVSFNHSTGAVGEASGDAISISISNKGAAIIPAQTFNGGLLSIVTDQGTATYSVADKTFAAGQLYTLNITVNLRAVGTTTAITGWTSQGTVTVNPIVTSRTPAGLEAIDLGNNLKWANMNVGAEQVTDYGTYFAWGETVGYTVVGATTTPAAGNVKTVFTWNTYTLCYDGDYEKLNMYNINASAGYVDNKTVLERIHDAASANWGSHWRMPTQEELYWLYNENNCTKTWITNYNGTGISGMLFTSKIDGYTDKSIFLPAAGYFDEQINNAGDYGTYWSSSLYNTTINTPENGWRLHFNNIGSIYEDFAPRCLGMPVRPVYVE